MDGRGVSKVVATVILAAFGVALAVAVSLWGEGFVSVFTGQQERVQVFTTVNFDPSGGGYVLEARVKNAGGRDVVIRDFLVNGRPFWESDVRAIRFYLEGVRQDLPLSFKLTPGGEAVIQLYLGESWKSGTTAEVRVRTTRGNEFFIMTALP